MHTFLLIPTKKICAVYSRKLKLARIEQWKLSRIVYHIDSGLHYL